MAPFRAPLLSLPHLPISQYFISISPHCLKSFNLFHLFLSLFFTCLYISFSYIYFQSTKQQSRPLLYTHNHTQTHTLDCANNITMVTQVNSNTFSEEKENLKTIIVEADDTISLNKKSRTKNSTATAKAYRTKTKTTTSTSPMKKSTNTTKPPPKKK